MYSPRELNALVTAMRANGVTALEVKKRGSRLRLVLPVSDSKLPASKRLPDMKRENATSPTYGIFLKRGIDDGLQPLKPGTDVKAGDVLGYLCNGFIRVVINAPVTGRLVDAGPKDGTALGLGDHVFTLELLA